MAQVAERKKKARIYELVIYFKFTNSFSTATAAALFGDADDISSDEEAANKVAEKVQASDDEAGERDERKSPEGSEMDGAERAQGEV